MSITLTYTREEKYGLQIAYITSQTKTHILSMIAVTSRSLIDIRETIHASLMNKSNSFQKKDKEILLTIYFWTVVYFSQISAMIHHMLPLNLTKLHIILRTHPWCLKILTKWMSERSKVRSIVGLHNIQL